MRIKSKRRQVSILDSKQYKEIQRQGWASVAKGWEKWWKTIEVLFMQC